MPERVYEELVDEFGDDAPTVAERALRAEITRHRITVAIKDGVDPAEAVAIRYLYDVGRALRFGG